MFLLFGLVFSDAHCIPRVATRSCKRELSSHSIELTSFMSIQSYTSANVRKFRYLLFTVGVLTVGLAISLIATAQTPASETLPCTETDGPTRALGLFKPGTPVSLEDGFRDPPAISRAGCWWQTHGSAFTKKEITRQLEEFKDKGMGGVTIKDTRPMPRDSQTSHIKDIDYMSPEWLDMFAHIVSECGRLGMICRSRLGSGWNEGGPWITPDQSTKKLFFVKSAPITGPGKFSGLVVPTAKDGSPTLQSFKEGNAFVVAFPAKGDPKGIDLTKQVDENRKLNWSVPAGEWTLVTCYSKASGSYNMSTSVSGRGLHHDHLSKTAANLHLENVAEKMLAKIGPFEKTAFDGFNSDSWELGNPTWTPGFRQAFVDRRGYDPVPFLPILADLPKVGGFWHFYRGRYIESRGLSKLDPMVLRFLYDLRLTVSDLIVENFYKHVSEYSLAHGVPFEAQAAGGPSHTIPSDTQAGLGVVTVPTGEFWVNGRSYVKIASSSSHTHGKRIVALEALTNSTFQKGNNHMSIPPSAFKPRVDEAFLLGGNSMSLSVVEYSPIEAGLPGWVHSAGPHLNHCQPYWPIIRPFYDYLARCSFMLQSGKDVAQVAVYHSFRTGEGAMWDGPADDNLASFPKEFAFDFIDDSILQNQMKVKDGRIVLGSGAEYQVLCISPTKLPLMPLATIKKIAELTRQGATVVWLKDPPTRAPGLTDYIQRDKEFKKTVQGLKDDGLIRRIKGFKSLVPIVEKSQVPSAWLTEKRLPLRFVHRRTAEAEIFFVVNRSNKPVDSSVTFRVKDRIPELWNPENGTMLPASFQESSDGKRVAIKLPPQGSVFVVFQKQRSSALQEKHDTKDFVATSIAIAGPWKVEFPENSGAPASALFSKLESWSVSKNQGIRYFSGIATYRTTFLCPEEQTEKLGNAVLDLGRVAEVCEVHLNGKRIGAAWHAPYRFDISDALQSGENQLVIRVANLWQNRLIGDAQLHPEKRISRIVPTSYYKRLKGYKLLKSGLLGPVSVVLQTDR